MFNHRKTEEKLRKLSVLIDNIKTQCQKKLIKAEHIFSLINQCQRLELQDEHLFLTISKFDSKQINNKIISQVHYFHGCHLEFDSFFYELSLFWQRFAHVQMDLYIRKQEKSSLKKSQRFFKQQLKTYLVHS